MAEKGEKTYRIIVSGRVQGVFFRAYTRKTAQRLGLKGYARNLSDGTIEVVAQGSEEMLKKLVEFCRKGPMFAKIENVDINEEKIKEEFERFEIRY